MYEKDKKMEFFDLKYMLFSGIFLSGIGGYPLSTIAALYFSVAWLVKNRYE